LLLALIVLLLINGNSNWLFRDADYGYTEFYNSIDTILVGRKTYEQSLTFEEDPYKGKKVYVFTHNAKEQKTRMTSDVEYVEKDIPEFVRRLIEQPFSNRDIWLLGGGKILSLFLNADLVDEIILSVHPIILGKGIPLFNNIKKSIKLRLLESIPFESGLVQLRYCILN